MGHRAERVEPARAAGSAAWRRSRHVWPAQFDPAQRELTHQHIEQCAACADEWTASQETWKLLDELPVVEPPAHLKQRFLAETATLTVSVADDAPMP